MDDWRANGLRALQDARDEMEAASEPTFLVVLTIAEADVLKERPVSVYSNTTWDWLHKFLCFVSWRTSLKVGAPSKTGEIKL